MQRRLNFVDGVSLSGLLVAYTITLSALDLNLSQTLSGFLVFSGLLIGVGCWGERVGWDRAGVLIGWSLSLLPLFSMLLRPVGGDDLVLMAVLIASLLFLPIFLGVGLSKLTARAPLDDEPSVIGSVARGVLGFGGGVAAPWLIVGWSCHMVGEEALTLITSQWEKNHLDQVWVFNLVAIPLFASGVVFSVRRALRFAPPWSNPKEGAVVCAVVCAALTAGFSATGMMKTGLYYPIHIILWVVAAVCGCLFAHARPPAADASPTVDTSPPAPT